MRTLTGLPHQWDDCCYSSDRPKSVCNCCVMDVFGVTLLFGFFCGCRGFCHRTESDLFFFLFTFVIVYDHSHYVVWGCKRP